MISELLAFIVSPNGSAGFAVLTVKSSAVVALGLLLWLAIRRASASARHLVLGATLVATMLLPLISILAPTLPLPILNSSPATQSTGELPVPLLQQQSAETPEGRKSAEPIAAAEPQSGPLSASALAFAVYLMGVFAVLAHLSIGLARVWWLSRNSLSSVHTRPWQLPKQRTAYARLLVTTKLSAPITWGVFRPVILLPASAESWSEQDRTNAILHELAHVERKDWLMQMLARLVCAVYWFNPLVWVARRHLILEAELAADDRVLASGSAPDDYAEQLILLSKNTRGLRLPVAATTMAEQSLLSRRVHSILNSGESRMPLNPVNKYALLSIVTVFAMFIASAQLVAAPQEAESATSSNIPNEVSTPLIRAAARGDNDEVKRLIQSGADVNEAWEGKRDESQDDRGRYPSERDQYNLQRTALATAASRGHAEVVQSLLDAGAPVDRVVQGDSTSLIAAASHNHENVTRLLIDRGADVNKAVRGDGSPLIAATRVNNVEIMKLMLSLGADPDLTVRGDENPLYHAVRHGNAESVELLISAGVDVNQEWPGDGTPLIVATRSGDKKTIDALIRAGAQADQGVRGDGNAMIVAAQQGDNDLLRAMLETGADANAAVKGDGSPLIQAARNGNMEGVVLLLQAGADINQVVKGDENALIGAAWEGDIEMVDYLLKSGADPNIQARAFGEVRTALRQAQLEGHEDVVRMLEAAGATE
jgi:ankyrin repeat protein/beta-lactamase regulating signal transducer with metallopeptidase domain